VTFLRFRPVEIIFLLFSLCLVPAHSAGGAVQDQPACVVVLIDQSQLEDWLGNGLDNLERLTAQGSLGLMNTNTGGARTAPGSHWVLARGRVEGTVASAASLSFEAEEDYRGQKAKERYQAYMGLAPSAQVLHLAIPTLENGATKPLEPLLGATIQNSGLTTAVVGNADLPDSLSRPGALLTMDAQGQTPYGTVGGATLIPGPLLPEETDYKILMPLVQQELQRAQLVVVELGDLVRLNNLQGELRPKVYEREHQRQMERIDGFLGQLTGLLDPKEDLLIVVSPTPSREALNKQELLTPVLLWGKGFTGGLAYSSSTRRAGVVTNTDLAPTILQHLGLKIPAQMTGRPLGAKEGQAAALLTQKERMVFTYQARQPMVKAYVGAQIGVVLASILLWFFPQPIVRKFIKTVIPVMMAIPLALLLIAGGPYPGLAGYAFLAVVTAIGVAAASFGLGRRNQLEPLLIICAATVMALCLDLLTGQRLISQSVLGYDALAGARYYGIGNEYMGVLIGAAMVSTGLLAELIGPGRRLLPGLFYVPVLLLIALPGRNFGGFLAGLGGFYLGIWALSGKRLNRRSLLILTGAGLAMAAGLIVVDGLFPQEGKSHLGLLADQLAAGGPQALWDVISRKWSMNVKLIQYTIWTRVFLVSLLAMGAWLYWPFGAAQDLNRRYPFLTRTLLASVGAAVIALLTNDSGIVAAATMTIYPASTLIFLAEKKIIDNQVQGH